MNSRSLALILTVLGGGLLFLFAPEEAALAPGSAGALLGVAAIWLASRRTRMVLAALSVLAWVVACALAVSASPAAVLAALIGLSGAGVTLLKGAGWPGWSARYARGAQTAPEEAASPRQMWESLDRGVDPTRPGHDPQ